MWISSGRDQPPAQTRELSEIKVFLWITRAFPSRPFLAFWTMCKVIVLVSDILKEMNLVFVLENSSGNTMYYRVSPTLVVEPATCFEVVKELCIRFASPEVHISDFKITPEVAQVVRSPAIVREETHRVVLGNVLRILFDKFLHRRPERRYCLHVFQHREGETIRFVVFFHIHERVVLDVTKVVDIGLDAPVVSVLL